MAPSAHACPGTGMFGFRCARPQPGVAHSGGLWTLGSTVAFPFLVFTLDAVRPSRRFPSILTSRPVECELGVLHRTETKHLAVHVYSCAPRKNPTQSAKLTPWTSSDYITVLVHVYVQPHLYHFQGVKGRTYKLRAPNMHCGRISPSTTVNVLPIS